MGNRCTTPIFRNCELKTIKKQPLLMRFKGGFYFFTIMKVDFYVGLNPSYGSHRKTVSQKPELSLSVSSSFALLL